MALPWLQLVQLVPSLVEVSRDLLKQTRNEPPREVVGRDSPPSELLTRISALEENERRQAELVAQMAEQLAGMTRAISALHRRVLWLSLATGASTVIALIAVFLAARAGA